MKSIFAVCVVVLACVLAAQAQAPPNTWPTKWIAHWRFVYTSNGTQLDGGQWFYDSTLNGGSLRQDNQHFCDVVKPNMECSAIFKNNNVYYYAPRDNWCCHCWTDLPISGPNWLNNAAHATYVGKANYKLLGDIPAQEWTFKTGDNTHLYYQTAAGNNPLALSGGGTDQQWIHVKRVTPNPNVFYTPPSCTGSCGPKFFCNVTKSAPEDFVDWMLTRLQK